MDNSDKVVLIDASNGVIMEYKGIQGTLSIDVKRGNLRGQLLNTPRILLVYEDDTIDGIKKTFKKCVNAYLEMLTMKD